MPNTYFQFKQFIIHQDKAAMKVGTDGVLLGAWASVDKCSRILDAGTGTGLIAIMLAQRTENTLIEAIDVDKNAIIQAQENIALSPWSDRIKVIKSAIQDFNTEDQKVFDHVISNPPFFANSYKNKDISKAIARHTDTLSYSELIVAANRLTSEKGRLSVIIPFDTEADFCYVARQEGFFLKRILRIRPIPKRSYIRVLIELSKEPADSIDVNEMIIEDKGRHGYSDRYIDLTKDFYVKM